MPKFANTVEGKETTPVVVDKARIRVLTSHIPECSKTSFVDVTDSGYLIAVNAEAAALKALICSEPLVGKESEPGAHYLEAVNLAGLSHLDIKARSAALKEKLAALLKHDTDPSIIQDDPTTNVWIDKPVGGSEVSDFRNCPQCSKIAQQIGEAFLVQKFQQLGLESFSAQLPKLTLDMNHYVAEHEDYLACLLVHKPKDTDASFDNLPEPCRSLLEGVEPGSKEAAAIMSSDTFKEKAAAAGVSYDMLYTHTAQFNLVCNPEDFDNEQDYLTCLSTNLYYNLVNIKSRFQLPEVRDFIEDGKATPRYYRELMEAYAPTKVREYDDCPTCNNYLFAVVVFKRCEDVTQWPAGVQALYARAATLAFKNRYVFGPEGSALWEAQTAEHQAQWRTLVGTLRTWGEEVPASWASAAWTDFSARERMAFVDWVNANYSLDTEAQLAQWANYTQNLIGNKNFGEWRDQDLVITIEHGDWLQLSAEERLSFSKYAEVFKWADKPIYEDSPDPNSSVTRRTAYEVCKQHQCARTCEPCADLYDPADPQKQEYMDCYIKNCLTEQCTVCQPCNQIAHDFGVKSTAYADCYLANSPNPLAACQATLEAFGRESIEYLRCVQGNCPPIGPKSKAQFEVNPASMDYDRSFVFDLLSGQELCIECCGIDRTTHLREYLECVQQHCEGKPLDLICSLEQLGDAAALESFMNNVTPENAPIPLEKINDIPFVDYRLAFKLRDRTDVEILEASKMVVLDAQPYYRDKILLKESGKVVTKLTRIISAVEAMAAIGYDTLSNMSEDEAQSAVAAYIAETQDLTFFLKEPGKAEVKTSSVTFANRCDALEAMLSEDCFPQPLKLDNCVFDPKTKKLTCTTLCCESVLEKVENCYRITTTNRFTKDVEVMQTCDEVKRTWSDERIECYKTLSRISPSAIDKLISTDPSVVSLLTQLNLSGDEALRYVKQNLICKQPILAAIWRRCS